MARQAYGSAFARVYDRRWTGFARQVAPKILDFYSATPPGRANHSFLDLCCGTGQMSVYFLERGYRVLGLDLSESMLAYARRNARAYIESGRADFTRADAARFTVDERFGLAVATYDSLNHLPGEAELASCFQCVSAVCDAFFVFDLNTRFGLRRWNNILVDEACEDALIINRGIYDGQSDHAWTRISGFVRTEAGLFERFEETVFNTVFDLGTVESLLKHAGWRTVHFARMEDLTVPVDEPEKEGRVFVVAGK